MAEQQNCPIFNLYVDDSGTRHPDKCKPTSTAGDWFGLGGFLIREEDEAPARGSYKAFCDKWDITYPLHSVKIRHRTESFSWLEGLSQAKRLEFYGDMEDLMLGLPIIAHGCVVHRPGYHARYFEKHAGERWHLCKTAFTILMERAAKFAAKHDRRIRVFVEESDKKSDKRLKGYFAEMRDTGMPFDAGNSSRYGPLSPEELSFRLMDFKFKRKSSPMMQLADLVLYPLCRSPYESDYRPMKGLRDKELLIDSHLAQHDIAHMGLKYSCFDT